MTLEQNVARGKAVTEFLELGESLCREGEYEPASFWLAVSVGAADRAGITRQADYLPRKIRTRSSVRLHDDSEMPFGKHKGETLGEVPGDYWRWFLGVEWCDEWPDLVEYANVILEDEE